MDIQTEFALNFAERKILDKIIILYNKRNYDSVNTELQNTYDAHEIRFPTRDTHKHWLFLKDTIVQLINSYMPTWRIKSNRAAPGFNHTLKLLNNKTKRLFWGASQTFSEIAWEAYRTAPRAYKTATHSAKHAFYNETLHSILQRNPRKF